MSLPSLHLGDPVALTAQLVDIPSVSGSEKEIADAIEAALSAMGGYDMLRDGDAVVARSQWGHGARVLLAGHIDTVPLADNVPSHMQNGTLYGCGTSDMKSGAAVMLHLAYVFASQPPACDLTFVFYDHEEVEDAKNGLRRLILHHPEWITGDMALLLEPTDGVVEGGCQGSLRARVQLTGRRAHAARSWLGENAIHAAREPLMRLARYEARDVTLDGCSFREGLNAVRIEGGVAGNIIPDSCSIVVNFRFAPDRTIEQATQHVREVFDGFEVELLDASPGALPQLDAKPLTRFTEGRSLRAKLGWTDVARLSAHGIPSVNFGPGDPNLAHVKEEHVTTEAILQSAATLKKMFTDPSFTAGW